MGSVGKTPAPVQNRARRRDKIVRAGRIKRAKKKTDITEYAREAERRKRVDREGVWDERREARQSRIYEQHPSSMTPV